MKQDSLSGFYSVHRHSPISRRHFRAWMLSAVIALNVVAVATVIYGLNDLYERDIMQAEILSRNVALAMDQSISNEVAKIDLSLQTVSRAIYAHEQESGRFDHAHIQEVVAHQKTLLKETEAWTVSDRSGRAIISAGDVENTNFSVADRAYFADLKSGKKSGLIVSAPVIGRLTGAVVVVLARTWRDGAGRFGGVVSASLPLSYFNQYLSKFDVGAKGLLTLRTADLELIARIAPTYAESSSPVGEKKVTEPLKQLIRSGLSAATYHVVIPFDRIERIVSYRRLDIVPIFVLVGISKHDYLAAWVRLCRVTLGFLVLFLAITNISAVLLYRQWWQQRRYAKALRTSNGKLETLLQEIQDRDVALVSAQQAGELGTYTLDISSGIWASSDQLNTIFGVDSEFPHTIDGWQQLLHEDERLSVSAYFFDDVIGRGLHFDREYRIVRHNDGKECWVHGLGKLDFDTDGKPVRLSGTIQDISKRKRNEARLLLSQEVFQSASEGIFVTDLAGTIIEINPAFTQITGYSHEEAVGKTPRILKSGLQSEEFYRQMWHTIVANGSWEGEFINRRKDGRVYVQHTRISAIFDEGTLSRFTGLISDITEFKESQRQVEYVAYHDKLTGLPNRVSVAQHIGQLLAQCQVQGKLLGVCYIDLDAFKPVNDECGHEVGDRVLIEVASRLKASIGADDVVARISGDEFVVLLSGRDSMREIDAAVERIRAGHIEPHQIEGFRSALTMSIGVTVYPDDAVEDADALIRHANQAMYEAKRNGKNRVCFYDLESEWRLRDHQQRYARLVEALDQNEFRLHYQPRVSLHSGAVAGVEALIRWQHPVHGLLSPDHFLQVIEASELTLSVGEWVLHEVMRQKQRWQNQGLDLTVSVNIFALHLQHADFVERVEHILRAYPDVDPGGLEFEILETTAMENLGEISDRIRKCMRLGIRFSLDDFGTGYSSLTYLRQLPVNVVKIDRSFLIDMLKNEGDRALVESIIGMTHMLHRKVVAEGVETLEHGILLLRWGCDFAQGYGIARPLTPEKLCEWLAQWQLPEIWKQAAESSVTEFS